jgi:virginiamycin B lyase
VSAGSTPSMICAGPDGRMWVTLNQANAVCAITLDGKPTIYPLPTPDAAPVGICASQYGVWFAEIGAGRIGRISPDGAITEFPLPDRSSRPHAVAATRDGGCWATLWASSSAIRLDQQGRIINEAHFTACSEPHGLAIAADNAVWVALEVGSLVRVADV